MPSEKLSGDRYRGLVAANYVAERAGPTWDKEHAAIERLLSLLPDAISVLDVPFGTGRFLPLYQVKRMTIAGVDISPDMFAAAKAEWGAALAGCDLRIAPADKLPFPDRTFDLVLCMRFLPHVVSFNTALRCMREFHRVTKQYAILMLKNHWPHVPTPPPPAPHEVMQFNFSRVQVVSLLADCGFHVMAEEMIPTIRPDRKNRDGEKRMFLLTRSKE